MSRNLPQNPAAPAPLEFGASTGMAAGTNSEVICIIRSPDGSQRRMMVIDRPSAQLMDMLQRESSGARPAAVIPAANSNTPDRAQNPTNGNRGRLAELPNRNPVVRAQSKN